MTLAASLSRSWVVFVRDSLKVTRTVRNNKLHFTWGCSIFLLKKEKGPEAGFLFFFSMILTFSKYLISNHNTLRYLLFSNVFRGFSILVCRGVQVFFRVFFFFFALLFSSMTRTWRSPCACLRLTKNAEKLPVLQIKASSMKLMIHGFLFLVFLHIRTDGKNKLFLTTTSKFR